MGNPWISKILSQSLQRLRQRETKLVLRHRRKVYDDLWSHVAAATRNSLVARINLSLNPIKKPFVLISLCLMKKSMSTNLSRLSTY